MQFNYKGVIGLFAIGIALIVLLAFIVPGAHAESQSGSYVVVSDYLKGAAPLNYIPRIEQGDTVYLNDTVDITGVSGWPGNDGEFRIAWYGQYVDAYSPEGLDPKFVLELPGKTRLAGSESQYRFYVDPDIFTTRTGYWYQYISNTSRLNGREGAGNLRAFKVDRNYRTITNATANTTEIVYFAGSYIDEVVKPEPLLPERKVSDYLVARGDPVNFYLNDTRLWVFGHHEGIYDNPNGSLMVDEIQNLHIGTYTMIFHDPGRNTIFEAVYSGGSLLPGLYGRKPINVNGFSPMVVYDRFRELLQGTDDLYYTHHMEVEDPYITIDRADEIFVNGSFVLDIRGYTNVANGTEIVVKLDEGDHDKATIRDRTVYGTAIRTSPGNLSYYKALMPIDYDKLAAANALNHTLTARTPIGGVVYKDFWISVLPPDSFKPNATIKYIEDRNPFVPTPTPVVLIEKVPMPGPVQVVTVVQTVTPDVSDYGRVAEGAAWVVVSFAFTAVAAIVVLSMLLWLATVYIRGRKK